MNKRVDLCKMHREYARLPFTILYWYKKNITLAYRMEFKS